MTPDDAMPDLFDYEWTADGHLVYASWTSGTIVYRTLVANCLNGDVANQLVAAQHARLEERRRPPRHRPLSAQIAEVLDRNSMEKASNTPDFLLGEYLERCLAAAGILISRRDGWYGVQLRPGHHYTEPDDTDIVAVEIVEE